MADIYVATTGNDSTGTGTSGNPYATPGKAGSVMAGGDRVLIKAGTYTATSASANVAGGYLNPPAGTVSAPSQVVGYNATVGDLDAVNDYSNFPVIRNSASGDTTTMRLTNDYAVVRNLIIDNNSNGGHGLYMAGANLVVDNCKAMGGATTAGFNLLASYQFLARCLATGVARGFYVDGHNHLLACVATACTTAGFDCDLNVLPTLIRCIAYANSGATVDGFRMSTTLGSTMRGCVSYGNGRHGLLLTGANAGQGMFRRNNLFISNGGYGVSSDTTNYTFDRGMADYEFFYNNTSGARNQWPAGVNDVALSGNPFTNAGSGDFSLNNTAGAGAAVRAAGYPGYFPGALTRGYLDGGAAQHADPAGGGGLLRPVGMRGGLV